MFNFYNNFSKNSKFLLKLFIIKIENNQFLIRINILNNYTYYLKILLYNRVPKTLK